MVVGFAGIQVDNVTLDEAADKAREFIFGNEPRLIVTPNPEIIVAAQEDAELKEILNSAALRIPDGISLVIVSRIMGAPLKERVAGIDLMQRIIELCGREGKKIFLLGSAPGVAEEAAAKLTASVAGANIVGAHHGYFENEKEVLQLIKDCAPDVLFVGLGAGRQEKWLKQHINELGVRIGMVIGGSLDVISGRKKRAPQWAQKLCIEWLYRLVAEPRRWRRQLALPRFLGLTLIRKVI